MAKTLLGVVLEERYTAKVLALVALYRRTGDPTLTARRLRQEKQVGVVQEFELQPYLICKVYLKESEHIEQGSDG